jgi:hypothetical protein
MAFQGSACVWTLPDRYRSFQHSTNSGLLVPSWLHSLLAAPWHVQSEPSGVQERIDMKQGLS